MATRGFPLLHVMHTPYDDNEILDEENDGVLGVVGTVRTTIER